MNKKLQIISTEFPYHITARCINREWFKIPLPEVWTIMEDQLYFLHHGFDINIGAFVLMPNHFHLLARSPKANLSQGMRYFMRETSRRINFRAHRINQTYGGRFHRSLIGSTHYFLHAYKYVYRNPCEAKLCSRPEDYPYSTLRGLLGMDRLTIPIDGDDTLFSNVEQTMQWLNRPTREAYRLRIKSALRRSTYSYVARSNSAPTHDLEYEVY